MIKLNTVCVVENHSLRGYNTFHLEAKARYFTAVRTEAEIFELLSHQEFCATPWLVLGGGSNILLTQDFPGLVVHIKLAGKQIVKKDDDFIYVQSAAGEEWHSFVLWTLQQGLSGLENLSLIPGNVGASPIQNIGAYGVEMKDHFYELTAIDKATRETLHFDSASCHFGYRDSIFKRDLKDRLIITSVCFKLPCQFSPRISYGDIANELKQADIVDPSAKNVSDAVCSIRKRKLPDPAIIGNAGSFFKNPVVDMSFFKDIQQKYSDLPYYSDSASRVKIPAAWLIEKAGWKGKTLGNAGVHDHHALVLINREDKAIGREVLALAQAIKASVSQQFGIELEPEPIIL